jgi:hypothetical protein
LNKGGFPAHRNRQRVKIRQKSGIHKVTSEKVVRDIRRARRKQNPAEEKICIVLDVPRRKQTVW